MSERRGDSEPSGPLVEEAREHLGRGVLIAIGGAEDKIGSRAILSQVVAMAGGKNARIALFPAGSQIPDEVDGVYRGIFEELGAEVRTVHVRERADAQAAGAGAALEGATAAFFTGGAQGRIVSLLGGTPLATAIRRAHREGMIVAGTSAGASVICSHMIAQGRSGYAPRRSSVSMAPGFGLTKRLVIDQHFAQRHRIGRLFAAVALNPFLIGVGIDENTAIVLDANNRMRVIGAGTVTVIDGSGLVHTDIHETASQAAAAVLGLAVHVLTEGHGYDAERRVPLRIAEVAALAVAAETRPASTAAATAAPAATAEATAAATAAGTNGAKSGAKKRSRVEHARR
ncbi:MAG: cyanophycinase [Myxococcales bacterium]|nr:cyanophycinase [Myxococcales bacterium]